MGGRLSGQGVVVVLEFLEYGLPVLLMPVLLWTFWRFTKAIKQQLNDAQGIPSSTRDWFQYFTYCIPKSRSEPWLGDLREKRQKMASDGYSRRAIEWATVIELSLLILWWGLEKALALLTPFKKS
jgi:hypothetical protein